MEAKEILETFNVFVVDTYDKKVTVMKRKEMFIKIIEWKEIGKKKELHYPFKNEVLSFIDENKILLQVA